MISLGRNCTTETTRKTLSKVLSLDTRTLAVGVPYSTLTLTRPPHHLDTITVLVPVVVKEFLDTSTLVGHRKGTDVNDQ